MSEDWERKGFGYLDGLRGFQRDIRHGKACGFFLTGYLRESDPADVSYLLNTAGFTDVDSLELYYQATCGRDEVPVPILRKSVEAPLSSPAKLAMAPFAVTEATLCRIAGLL